MIFIYIFANTILTSSHNYSENDNLRLNSSITDEINSIKSGYQKSEIKLTMEDEVYKYDFNTLNEFLDRSTELQEIDKFAYLTNNTHSLFEIYNFKISLAEYQDYINKLQAFIENQPDCGLKAKIEIFVEKHQHFANQYSEYIENSETEMKNEKNRLILKQNIDTMRTNLDSCAEMINLNSRNLENIEQRLDRLNGDLNEIDEKILQIKLKDQDLNLNELEIEDLIKKLCKEKDSIPKINLTELKICLNYAEKSKMFKNHAYKNLLESLYEKTVKYISEEPNFNEIFIVFKKNLTYKSGFLKFIKYFALRYDLNFKTENHFYIMTKKADYINNIRKIPGKTLCIDENASKILSELNENELKLLSVTLHALEISHINCDDPNPRNLIRNISFLQSVKNLSFTKHWIHEDLRVFTKANTVKTKNYFYVNSHFNEKCIVENNFEDVLGCHYFLQNLDFEELKDNTDLVHLDYTNTNITQSEMEVISQLSCLYSLVLSGEFTGNFDLINFKVKSLDFLYLSKFKNEYIPQILNLLQDIKQIALPFKNNMNLDHILKYKNLNLLLLVGQNGTKCIFDVIVKSRTRAKLVQMAPDLYEESDLLDGNFNTYLEMFKVVKINYKNQIELKYSNASNDNLKSFSDDLRKVLTTFETLKSIEDLTHLEVSGPNLYNMEIKKTGKLTNLASLSLLQTNLNNGVINKILRNHNITALKISTPNFTDEKCPLLYPVTLSTLAIEGESIGISGIEFLADLPNLRNLTLSNCAMRTATCYDEIGFQNWKIVEKTINRNDLNTVDLKLERIK